MTTMYLVDNDTLSRMSAEQRRSTFVRTYCRIPAEVVDEADSYLDSDVRDALDYPVTVTVLDNLRHVMARLTPGDPSVVDLYGNKGSGDAMLLATALTEIANAEWELFGATWTIATGDRGLAAMAAELGIVTCTDAEFIALVATAI